MLAEIVVWAGAQRGSASKRMAVLRGAIMRLDAGVMLCLPMRFKDTRWAFLEKAFCNQPCELY